MMRMRSETIVIAGTVLLALVLAFSSGAGSQGGPDSDLDGVPDANDNCVNVANGSQSDGDSDGYGDICDHDTNNDCQITNADISAIQASLGESEPPDSPYDVNEDGVIAVSDITTIIPNVGTAFTAESGLSCAACDGSPTGAGAPGPCQ